jgi:pimeloyl-ACP methyl ester carboxylesterase/KaiC/GvpD/RAD55 family RecA-like ATPase
LEYDWESPIWRPWLNELGQDFFLVRYDPRGCGLSDWNTNEISLEAWVRDLEEVVNAVGLDRFALLGLSQGGPVGIEYSRNHLDKVRQLILWGAFAVGWIRRGKVPEEERSALLALIRGGWGRESPAYRAIITNLFFPDANQEQTRWFNELQRKSMSAESSVRYMTEVGNIDITDRLTEISIPTLVMHARGDSLIPYEEGRLLAASIPNARLVTLESRNHVILEREASWSKAFDEIRNFCGIPEARSSAISGKVVRMAPEIVNAGRGEESAGSSPSNGMSSGVPALDKLLVKGYPAKSAILILGPSESAKESLMYRFIRSGLIQGNTCLYVTRLSTSEVLEDAQGFGIDMQEKSPLWLSRDSNPIKYDANNLASLSFNIKDVLRQNANQRIRIALDIVSSILMTNQPETIYKFLAQLFQDTKQYDAVLVATIEETMHRPEILGAMEQVFDGVIVFTIPHDGSKGPPILQVRKMRGMPRLLELRWEADSPR